MQDEIKSDIDFQPETKEYSYSNSPKGKEKKSNIFLTLLIEIFTLLFLFFVFLAVLNYFNILSLSALYPNQLGFLPHRAGLNQQQKNTQLDTAAPVFLPKRNSWLANGTLYSYNDNQIEIKVGKKIVKLEFSSAESMFYKSFTTLDPKSGSNTVFIPDTLYELEKKENIGKKVEVFYTQDKSGKNTIQTIKLIN